MSKLDHPIDIKTAEEIEVMRIGGEKLARVKEELKKKVAPGVNALEIEDLATSLIKKEGAISSFKMVSGYHWSTCVNVNGGIVHGIPKKEIVFKKGDLVSVDVGLYYEGFHTDTSFSVGLDLTPENKAFLKAGSNALENAIKVARPGNRIHDISHAIESTLKPLGYLPIRALVGHGVGRNLHEEPQIPGIAYGRREDTPLIEPGMALAIEVMYSLGSPEIALEEDQWTIVTRDGKISALFEETVAIKSDGIIVLTR